MTLAVSNANSRLRQVGADVEVEVPAPAAKAENAALGLILLALKALGQRAVVAIAALATTAALGSVWWLFYSAIPADPSVHQLTALGLYGALVLAVLWVRR